MLKMSLLAQMLQIRHVSALGPFIEAVSYCRRLYHQLSVSGEHNLQQCETFCNLCSPPAETEHGFEPKSQEQKQVLSRISDTFSTLATKSLWR